MIIYNYIYDSYTLEFHTFKTVGYIFKIYVISRTELEGGHKVGMFINLIQFL